MVDSPEPSAEQVAIDQRATDPRIEAPEPVIEPVVESQEPDLTAVEAPVTDSQPEPPAKVKKTAEDVLKGRVGHLTKTLSAKDVELEAALRRATAAEALLTANTAPIGGEEAPKPVSAPNSNVYTAADFEAAVAAKTEAQEFNRKADEMYNVGAAKYTDWKDSVDTLVASGFMDKDLLESAMAVEDGAAVLHHLGVNLDEAERINALTPIRKAAEMAKLSVQLSAPRNTPVSSAPAPIRPVTGSPNPSIDLERVAATDDMKAYAAARAKQGSRWARG